MKKLVIIPGGFHPFHSGHMALYNAAREMFPSADVYVAATADTSERPFPFSVKKALAKTAGVPANRFIQVKSPFRPEEITQFFDPNDTQLIYVRSEKDRGETPQAGGVKKDGTPSYLQPYRRNGLQPMAKHGYIAYLPTVQFGTGMTSATEIRSKWPGMTPENKISLVRMLYPTVADNDAAAGKLVDILDRVLITKSTDDNKSKSMKEAKVTMHPELGMQVIPDGGLGSYRPESLERAVYEHMKQVLEQMRAGNWEAAEYLLYRWRVLEAKIKAMKEYMAWTVKNRGRGIKPGETQDISGLSEDYMEEK